MTNMSIYQLHIYKHTTHIHIRKYTYKHTHMRIVVPMLIPVGTVRGCRAQGNQDEDTNSGTEHHGDGMLRSFSEKEKKLFCSPFYIVDETPEL